MQTTSMLKSPRLRARTAAATVDAPPAPQPALFAMLSHRGMVRHTNEDACGAHPDRGIFVVCDGMGGAAAGEVASQLAVDAFLESLTQPRRIPPKSAAGARGSGARTSGHFGQRLAEAIHAANQAVYRGSQRSRNLRGMGTTLVALLFEDSNPRSLDERVPPAPAATLWLAHVGDSRCYLLRRRSLHPLTRDHSLVEEQIQAGLLSRVQAGSSPIRNIITRAIGSQPTVQPEIAAHAVEPGDLYLLASDGLTRDLAEAEIAGILNRALANRGANVQAALDAAVQALVNAANAKGGGDNITVLLTAVPAGADFGPNG